MKTRLIVTAVSFSFVLLFLYAALSKLINFQNFRVQLSQSPLLTAYAGWFAWIVPAIEIAISSLLLSSRWRLPGLYGAFSLMVMFTAYIIAILQFSQFVPCSCGGILSGMHWGTHLVFNIIFTVMGASGIIFFPKQPKIKSSLQ